MEAPPASVWSGLARNDEMSGPTQTTRSASPSALASEGRMAWACGDAPGGTSSAGSPTPCITDAVIECIGRIEATTFGGSAFAAVAKAHTSNASHIARMTDSHIVMLFDYA